MTAFQIIALLLTLAAIGGYLNSRFIRFPDTIGHMAFALVVSVLAIALNALGWIDLQDVSMAIAGIDFSEVLLHGMLSFLLFAGALHIRLDDLKSVRYSVGLLATFGVAIATLITGTLLWAAAQAIGVDLPYIYALLFGTLISPTDPIAVLAILKQAGLPKTLYAKIGGESLFNDGIGVVLFLTILGIATSNVPITAADVTITLLREAMGGLALGVGLGWGAAKLLRTINEPKLEVLITLSLVTGGYTLAESLHISAPIAMVAAGLVIGNSRRVRNLHHDQLGMFWELLDEVMNAVLFMLIGFQIMVIDITPQHALLGAMAIIAVLVGRIVSVSIPIALMSLRQNFGRGTIRLLTWGGLRGGISIAMALSLPAGAEKDLILPLAYIVVLFSILGQGLTFRKVIEKVFKQA